MKENINKKLMGILGKLDADKLKNSSGKVSDILSRGSKLTQSLSEEDKKALLDKFMSLDEKQISESLKNADLSALEKLSAQDIIKKLR